MAHRWSFAHAHVEATASTFVERYLASPIRVAKQKWQARGKMLVKVFVFPKWLVDIQPQKKMSTHGSPSKNVCCAFQAVRSLRLQANAALCAATEPCYDVCEEYIAARRQLQSASQMFVPRLPQGRISKDMRGSCFLLVAGKVLLAAFLCKTWPSQPQFAGSKQAQESSLGNH